LSGVFVRFRAPLHGNLLKLHYYAEFRKIKGNWNEMKGKLKQKFADLTDDFVI
jgi:hypothetical protein